MWPVLPGGEGHVVGRRGAQRRLGDTASHTRELPTDRFSPPLGGKLLAGRCASSDSRDRARSAPLGTCRGRFIATVELERV